MASLIERVIILLLPPIIHLLIALPILLAAEKFQFKEHPVNQSVLIGSDVLLRCSLAHPQANSPFHIQWRTNYGIILGHQQNSFEIPGYAGRYSYIKDSPEELHLRIANVSLRDDGIFQCQVLKPGGKFLRANALVNVLVPPSSIMFENYQSGGTIVVNEGIPLNITCVSLASKPQTEMNLFMNGKKAVENVHRGTFEWENGTANTYASLALRPGKNQHNKMISCEANHPETDTKMRDTITLDVYYSSDRPKIDLIGAEGDKPMRAGQNITLLCTADGGNPPPQLLWANQHTGQTHSDYSYDGSNQITRNALSFVVQGTDNGKVFECTSQTHKNMTPLISRVALHVNYPPDNVLIFGSTMVRKGETLAMSCTSSVSSPASVITWQINGSPTKVQPQEQEKQTQGLTTKSNITIDSNSLLYGQNQITVECIASNGLGTPISRSHVIRVLSPPSHPIIFETEPSLVPVEGTLFNLSCEAQGGSPFATLSWFRGVEKHSATGGSGKHHSSSSSSSSSSHQQKKKIKWKQLKETDNSLNGDSSRSTVTLLLDRSMNHQQIRCEAENGATDVPLVAKKNLIVLFPPSQVKVHPTRNANMVADSPTQLGCYVPSSNPVADLAWEFPNSVNKQLTITRSGEHVRKSNKPLGEYRGYESENVIHFTPTEAMDGAEVRCVATHHLWTEVKYGTYRLDVKYPPRIAVEGQMSIVVGEGQSFEENITMFANPRVNAFAWRKNGITIDRSVGTIFTRQSLIGGIGVGKDDSGIYTLFVSNGVGTANATIKLVVEYSARITYVTSPVIASVGEDVVLECEADGMPMKVGMIRWLRGQSEVKSLVQDQRRAVIRMNASHENSGAYVCLVDNGIGQPNYTTAYLLVRRAPEIVKRPGFNRAAGPIGGKATLRCRANAVPNAEFTWGIEGEGHMIHHNTTKYRFFDTQLDHTTFQSTLTIMHLEQRDFMRRYRCRVSNRLGLAQTFISVGPPTAPEMPSELEIVNVTNSTASISWMPGFDGGSDQMFQLIHRDLDGELSRSLNTSESQIVLQGLELGHNYQLQIRAINARGDVSDVTQPLLFQTIDEKQQNGIVAIGIIPKDGPVSQSTVLAICLGLVGLLLLNCVLICFLNRRNKRRRMQEKSALTQHGVDGGGSTASSGVSGGRTIQIYGAMSALQHHQHHPQQQRPGSTPTTNRSDLANNAFGGGSNNSREPTMADNTDSQSNRTIIEVSPYGHFNGNMANNDYFYNANCVADFDDQTPTNDYYSKIQKGANYNGIMNYSVGHAIDANLSYQAIPNPEPPYASNTMLYSDHMCPPNSLHYGPPVVGINGTVPGSPFETRSACYMPAASNGSGGIYVDGTLPRTPKLMSTFQHHENGISIRDTHQGDLV